MFGLNADAKRRTAALVATEKATRATRFQEYVGYVHERASVSGPSIILLSNSRESVEVIVTEIFRQAHSYVYLYGMIFDQESLANETLIATIAGFVARNPKARVVFALPPNSSGSVFVDALRKHDLIGSHVSFARPRTQEFFEHIQVRFIVSDDGSYWNADRRIGYRGIAQFHDSEKLGKELIRHFDSIYNT